MDVAMSLRFSLEPRMLASSFPITKSPRRTQNSYASSFFRASLSTCLVAPSICGGAGSGFFGPKIRPTSLTQEASGSPCSRAVVTMVIPFAKGSAWEQPPPDLASYLYKNRIIYLGMSLVPSVTELILAEFLYLQFEDMTKPVYLYINSTGTTKGGEKFGYETEAFAIYDIMRYMGIPVFTLCVGNAWGEAALLLAAGAKGNRAALPSSTIMIRQPISRVQGQASDVEIVRKEMRNVKAELVKLYAKHFGKTTEQIQEDIRRPKYFSPSEAVEYGIIDKVLYSARSKEDRGIIANLKKAKMI